MDTSTIFKAYDIRGTYPDQLDKRVAEAVGSSFGVFVKSPQIVIARDMRTSGETLSSAFAKGARAVGVEVVDLGLASTDFLYFATGYLGVPGAIVLTDSLVVAGTAAVAAYLVHSGRTGQQAARVASSISWTT